MIAQHNLKHGTCHCAKCRSARQKVVDKTEVCDAIELLVEFVRTIPATDRAGFPSQYAVDDTLIYCCDVVEDYATNHLGEK